MLQLDSTTVSAAQMRIKFHCMPCLYVYGNKVILSYLMCLNASSNVSPHSEGE